MCWRDNVVQTRWCSFCGQSYYGDLGHRNCPKAWKPKAPQAGFDSSSLTSIGAREQGPQESKR
jgi:hypothetical protein